MNLPIDVAGFNRYISVIPGGNLIVLRGGIEPAKDYLSQLLSYTAVKQGGMVSYITSRGTRDLKSHLVFRFGDGINMSIHEDRSPIAWLRFLKDNDLLVIDSFSYLMMGKSVDECRTIIEELRNEAKERGSVVLLILDDDLLDRISEAAVLHLADGILSFRTLENGEGIRRLVRVERWTQGEIVDENIYYSFIEGRMNVDLRYRIA